ncbi:hypothetical protein UP03_21615, partial [Enterobacter hormaechei]
KEDDAQKSVKRFYVVTQRGLRHVKALRRSMHVKIFRHHEKIAQQSKMHTMPLLWIIKFI